MFNNLLLANIDVKPTDANRRRIVMTNLTLIAMSIIYPSFFVINLIKGEYLVATVELFFIFPVVYGLYLIRKNREIEKASLYTTLLLFTTTLIVVNWFSGREYILLWSYIFAFVVMALQGPKKGLYYSIVFYLAIFISAYGFIGDAITIYEYIRFIVIAVIVVIIAYFYERSTKNAFDLLHQSINEIEFLNKNLNKRVEEEIAKTKGRDKLLEEQSRLAQMGEMISMIAHQWRQPLTSISSITGTLSFDIMTGNYKEDFFAKRLENINELAQHLSSTIDDFRNFFKPNKESELVLINTSVIKALNIIRDSLDSKEIKILESYESSKKVNIYMSEMLQVILNILKNAQDNFVQNSIENAKISIKTYDEDEKTIITICDNGGGIPENIIDQIFHPYFSTKHEKDGTGLGLYMSKTIVEEHHSGEFYAKNIDNGVCFYIIIPSTGISRLNL